MKLIGVIFVTTFFAACESKLAVKLSGTRTEKKCAGLSAEECTAKESKEDLTVVLASTSLDFTNLAAIPFTATFSSAVKNFELANITVTNGTADDLEGTDDEFTFTVKPTTDGIVTVNMAAGVTENSSKKKNLAAAEVTRTFDGTSPSATLASAAASASGISPIPVTATFTEIVTGFTLEDVVVTNGTATNFLGSGKDYTFDVVPSASGLVTVNVPAASASDAATNTNFAAASLSRTYNSSSPSVTLTSSASATTNASPIPVTATFSMAVTGFVAGDITVANGSISGFAGSGMTYTFNVTPTGQGAVTVDVASGVALSSGSIANTAAAQLSRTYDTAAPTVALSSASAAAINAAFSVTATFSESVTVFVVGDITVGNGTVSNFTGSGTTYTFDVTPTAGGAVTVNVSSGVAADAAINSNSAATQLSRTYDITQPTVTLTSAASASINAAYSVTATFSESVTGFAIGDIRIC